MANIPITGLPAATVPLSGSEIGVLVQGGATVQTPLGSMSPVLIADITALRALNLSGPFRPRAVEVITSWNAGDGGGVFRLDTSDVSSTDNGGTIIVDAAGNRWKRQFTGPIYGRFFNLKGDGSTEDTAVIHTIATAAGVSGWVIIDKPGDYIINDVTLSLVGQRWTCGPGVVW